MPSLEPAELSSLWESVVDTMAEGLFLVDTEGIVVFMNPAAERITGYRAEEVLGKPCSFLESDTCRGCRDGRGRLTCGLFKEGREMNKRCVVTGKGGRRIHLVKNATVLRDKQGRVLGGVETMTDVTGLVDRDRRIEGLQRELQREYGFEGLLGVGEPMASTFHLLDSAARSEAPVMILGASGTGKELAAAAIHRRSPRTKGPFIRVNCAALNETLLESELFGHERGAFTGAERRRTGRFEAADGGSLFLDEIGDLPPAVQVKLLRVLQEGEIERVGSNQPIKLDVRIISATNRNLEELVREGRLREDLYYRVNVIPIHLPALKERPGDIPLLLNHFLERAALRSGRPVSGISPRAMSLLSAYAWPGNVRELINAVEYALVIARSGEIGPEHLPPQIAALNGGAEGLYCGGPAPPYRAAEIPAPARTAVTSAPPPHPAPPACKPGPRGIPQDPERAKEAILAALEETGGHKAQAAGLLGVSRVTLWKWLKKLGLEQ